MPLDSTNWSRTTETETKPDVFSLEGLIAWLETQLPETEYDWGDCRGGCLIGLYGTARGLPVYGLIGESDFYSLHSFFWEKGVVRHVACPSPHLFGAALSRARSLIASRNSNAYLAETHK